MRDERVGWDRGPWRWRSKGVLSPRNPLAAHATRPLRPLQAGVCTLFDPIANGTSVTLVPIPNVTVSGLSGTTTLDFTQYGVRYGNSDTCPDWRTAYGGNVTAYPPIATGGSTHMAGLVTFELGERCGRRVERRRR